MENYVRKYEKLAVECEFLPRLESLLSRVNYPLQQKLQEELEELDAICCSITYEAEKKCRKLCKGQVVFSPELQQACRQFEFFPFCTKSYQAVK